jgi:hypothetical protein
MNASATGCYHVGTISFVCRKLTQLSEPLQVGWVGHSMDHPVIVRAEDREVRGYVVRDGGTLLES